MLKLTIMCQGGDALYSDGSKILKKWPAPVRSQQGDRFESPSVAILKYLRVMICLRRGFSDPKDFLGSGPESLVA